MIHQTQCRACNLCQYLCPVKECDCSLYYYKDQLLLHFKSFQNLNFIDNSENNDKEDNKTEETINED